MFGGCCRFNTVEELNFALINEMGLSINPGNKYLYSQDDYSAINCGGKFVKCSINQSEPVYPSDASIVFDPINNMRLMTFFMGYYFEKENTNGEIYIMTYHFNEVDKRGPSSITVKCNNGNGITDITSRSYNNKALKFCDIILRLSGNDVDLSNFDQVV